VTGERGERLPKCKDWGVKGKKKRAKDPVGGGALLEGEKKKNHREKVTKRPSQVQRLTSGANEDSFVGARE